MTISPDRIPERTSTPARFNGLPMPKQASLLFEEDLRPRVIREHRGRWPFPIPNGWFIVAMSEDLPVEGVEPIYAFGKELVLFRDAFGAPRVLDAHCPHLGAHLGVGGQVDGSCLRCPFHGWAFNGESGRCEDVPYDESKKMPTRARIGTYPTIERNGAIWAWHHLEGGAPFYDVPEVFEFSSPDWSAPVMREFTIRTCAQEMAENNVDLAHFKFVHGFAAEPEENFVVDGAYKRAERNDGSFTREGFGLGLGVLRVRDFVTWISSTTPIDRDTVHVRWIFTAPAKNGPEGLENAVHRFCEGISQDIPIWENKIYQDRPVLRGMEGDIIQHRRWSEQFYSGWPVDEVPAQGGPA
ncbi:MAG TPA: Rieske 2Fe-2S domain-containing protein [Egibacteraceae bacterium]|nr:Rieske 2Fe-2S domain-containing protein [Egibacteraceae bacterium]